MISLWFREKLCNVLANKRGYMIVGSPCGYIIVIYSTPFIKNRIPPRIGDLQIHGFRKTHGSVHSMIFQPAMFDWRIFTSKIGCLLEKNMVKDSFLWVTVSLELQIGDYFMPSRRSTYLKGTKHWLWYHLRQKWEFKQLKWWHQQTNINMSKIM